MKRNVFLVIFVMLVIGVSVLYAQTATLQSGVYQMSGHAIEFILTGRAVAILRDNDGTIVNRGRWEQVDDRINLRWDDRTFEVLHVQGSDYFMDSNFRSWYRVRAVRDSDLRGSSTFSY